MDGAAEIEGFALGIDDGTLVEAGLVFGWLDRAVKIDGLALGIDVGTPVLAASTPASTSSSKMVLKVQLTLLRHSFLNFALPTSLIMVN